MHLVVSKEPASPLARSKPNGCFRAAPQGLFLLELVEGGMGESHKQDLTEISEGLDCLLQSKPSWTLRLSNRALLYVQ